MNYYDENAEEFFENTVNADMTPHYKKFLEAIPEGCHILDAGCGSGRDTLKFMEKMKKFRFISEKDHVNLRVICSIIFTYKSVNIMH